MATHGRRIKERREKVRAPKPMTHAVVPMDRFGIILSSEGNRQQGYKLIRITQGGVFRQDVPAAHIGNVN